jgi:hypothetical protein
MQAWQQSNEPWPMQRILVTIAGLGSFGHHHPINPFKLHNAASPYHNLTKIFIPAFDRFQYDVEKSIVAAQGPRNRPVAIQRKLEPLVLLFVQECENQKECESETKRKKVSFILSNTGMTTLDPYNAP